MGNVFEILSNLGHIFRVCSECVQSVFRVSSEYLQSFFRVSSEYVQSLLVVKIVVIALSSASSVSIFGIFFVSYSFKPHITLKACVL